MRVRFFSLLVISLFCSLGYGSPANFAENYCVIYHIDGGFVPSARIGPMPSKPYGGVLWYTPSFSEQELVDNRSRALRQAQTYLSDWISDGRCPRSTSLIPICEPTYKDLCAN